MENKWLLNANLMVIVFRFIRMELVYIIFQGVSSGTFFIGSFLMNFLVRLFSLYLVFHHITFKFCMHSDTHIKYSKLILIPRKLQMRKILKARLWEILDTSQRLKPPTWLKTVLFAPSTQWRCISKFKPTNSVGSSEFRPIMVEGLNTQALDSFFLIQDQIVAPSLSLIRKDGFKFGWLENELDLLQNVPCRVLVNFLRLI